MTKNIERHKTNEHQVKGKCQVCGQVNHTSIWRVFLQDGWFRGDDINLGKFCKKCKTRANIEKRIEALNDQKH